MGKVWKVSAGDDARDAVHAAVETLAQGGVIGLALETVYVPIALALNSDGVRKLATAAGMLSASNAWLVVRTPDEILDYIPDLGEVGRRLKRRCLPGPIAISAPIPPQAGMIHGLPADARKLLDKQGHVTVRMSACEALSNILRLVPGPLVIADESQISPLSKTAESFNDTCGTACDLVIDSGAAKYGKPASVVTVPPESVPRKSWRVSFEGVVPGSLITRYASELILFVCTGNTCRSPMAEALFRRMLAERLGCTDDELLDRGFIVGSAGIAAMEGSPATMESVQVMAEQGIDLHEHESRLLTQRLLSQVDRVYTMTRGHRDAIVREFPEHARRVQLLTRDGRDVRDPIGGGLEDYQATAELIEEQLRAILETLNLNTSAE